MTRNENSDRTTRTLSATQERTYGQGPQGPQRPMKNAGYIILMIGAFLALLLTACSSAAEPPPQPTTPAAHYVPLTLVPTPNSPRPLPKSREQMEATTVLLLGTDRRDTESSTDNTDTLMLFQIDPKNQRIAVLSIPRDLYFDIPGCGKARINSAYACGEQGGTGGLASAQQAVSSLLDIPVQHAILLDFNAFVTLVDTVGGVNVDVPHPISDPTYPDSGDGYDPFYLSAGQHHMDGATALKYVRTRATIGGDFDRITRQQQMVLAVRDQITQLDQLPHLIAESPQLWATLQSSFETNLTLGEMVDLAVIASRAPTDQIVTASIDQTYARAWTTPAGAQVLIPDQAAIETLALDLFTAPPTAAAQ